MRGMSSRHRIRTDSHGSMTRMPHVPVMLWDFKDQLHAASRQVVNDGVSEFTLYVYASNGQRLRKVTEHRAGAGETPRRRHERLYLGALEVYREHSRDGSSITIERETLHVSDDNQRRIAQIDTRTQGTDDGPAQSRRFVLSTHLRSAALEVDEDADVVSYEEYRPYGDAAYLATRSGAEVSLKRYRYTGKERDEETGLYYHGARYYAAWLGRWSAADPAGIADGLNRYTLVRGNPIVSIDLSGASTDPVLDDLREQEAELQRAYRNESGGPAQELWTEIEEIREQIKYETQLIADAAETPMPGETDETYNKDVNVTGYIPPQEERFSHSGVMDRVHSAQAERATRMETGRSPVIRRRRPGLLKMSPCRSYLRWTMRQRPSHTRRSRINMDITRWRMTSRLKEQGIRFWPLVRRSSSTSLAAVPMPILPGRHRPNKYSPR